MDESVAGVLVLTCKSVSSDRFLAPAPSFYDEHFHGESSQGRGCELRRSTYPTRVLLGLPARTIRALKWIMLGGEEKPPSCQFRN